MIINNNEDDDYCWWNRIPSELKYKGEIECYEKLNELHPKYPIIIYNHARRYKQKLKKLHQPLK